MTNSILVVALTAPIGGGVILDSKSSGYLSPEGLAEVRKAVINSAKISKSLQDAPRQFSVELREISLAEGLLKIAQRFDKSVICKIHRIPYISESSELIKMGFTGNDCYERAQKLYEHIEFHEWIPDYIRQMVYSTEVCGELVVFFGEDATNYLPHNAKIIGYLQDRRGEKRVFI